MVITETFYIDGVKFTRNYSDAGRYVVRDGASYTEACDPAEFNRVYTEGSLISVDEIDPNEEIIPSVVCNLLREKIIQIPQEEEPDFFSEHEPEINFFE